jgi:hypothetical protein
MTHPEPQGTSHPTDFLQNEYVVATAKQTDRHAPSKLAITIEKHQNRKLLPVPGNIVLIAAKL